MTAALALAGFSFYLIEDRRIDVERVANVEQELREFHQLAQTPGPYSFPGAIDPNTGETPRGIADLLYGFVQRNIATDAELLIGWYDGAPQIHASGQSGREAVAEEAQFLDAVRPLLTNGGNARVAIDDEDLLLTVQPATVALDDGTDDTGALVVVTFTDADDQLHETVRTYALVATVALLVVVVLAALQSGRLLRPLRVLRRNAEEISETDLSRRIPETGNDDITALTRTVNGMLARLETAFTTQRQFLDDAGHELKTPLTILRGHLELMEPRSADDAETKELLLDEVDRMARLVADLLVLAKSDRPDFLTLAPVDVADLVASVHAKARALGERRWVFEPPPNAAVAVIDADEQRLTQALLQLCDNAVKHTTVGQTVAIGYDAPAPDLVRLWVRDSGPGVPQEDRERIFERFGRSVVFAGDEGFGLGLSIVAAIVHAHGGAIDVEPAHPSGARFVMTLTQPWGRAMRHDPDRGTAAARPLNRSGRIV